MLPTNTSCGETKRQVRQKQCACAHPAAPCLAKKASCSGHWPVFRATPTPLFSDRLILKILQFVDDYENSVSVQSSAPAREREEEEQLLPLQALLPPGPPADSVEMCPTGWRVTLSTAQQQWISQELFTWKNNRAEVGPDL
ncbi:hypothetical protein DPEC_G00102120 [Dallia pectoralis]|uniref:Uncharacterized protein n=1 Tax=Dallia pectoralis TaxID=75939 RepID=A0ACC2GXY6_DALPE|nr:hypothetical protein DPEC_G00102120 [Dallia pectoralis]